MVKIELLAPAKDYEHGVAAIKCGADAVYIGAESLGARHAAANSVQDIEKLALFAHKYAAKVYVTINTIINDNEIPQAAKLIEDVYSVGADAVIIQDMGLLELELPPIKLFSSTQTDNRTPEKVKFLEKVGFDRVILSRELSLEQIKEISVQTKINLEFFIHGALCVCYSGQCYMSYSIGKRSANKGQCAQPCRKRYSLMDSAGKIITKDKYLLSLKDLNNSKNIYGLIDAGISSFKIEGRLKDLNYVKNIVSYYRRELDIVLEAKKLKKSSSGRVFIDFYPNPYKTFNRGYTEYFLNAGTDNTNLSKNLYPIASINTPKSIGEEIGRVRSVHDNFFTITSQGEKLHNADGICFFDKNTILKGMRINKAEDDRVFVSDNSCLSAMSKGTIIYRNYDHEFTKTLEKSKIQRKIYIEFSLCTIIQEGEEVLILSVVDEDGINASVKVKNIFEKAKNPNQALESIRKQLLKLGGSIFYSEKARIELKEACFIPAAVINELRRNLVLQLEKNRIDTYKKGKQDCTYLEQSSFQYPEKILDYRANVINSYSKRFYERHGAQVKEFGAESDDSTSLQGKPVMTTRYCIRKQLGICLKSNDIDKIKSIEPPLFLLGGHEDRYELKFSCRKSFSDCEMQILNFKLE